ncbi:hypothetical protein JCM18899A_32620 [Nocardioides sp. AN3]
MTPEMIADLPDELLGQTNTEALREWLALRGKSMTLLELDTERRLRGLQPRTNAQRRIARRMAVGRGAPVTTSREGAGGPPQSPSLSLQRGEAPHDHEAVRP